MSISVFPGAVNADLGGYAGTFFQRAQKLVGACICFLVSGGDIEALTEDILDKEPRMGDLSDRAETRFERTAERHFDNRFVQPVHPAGAAPHPAHPGYPAQHSYHDPLEPTRVYHRAITPLFAGAAPEAGGLGGRVSASRLRNCPTYRLTGHVKTHFQYLTAWARVTLPSKKALSARLATKLWEWCEARIEEHLAPSPKLDTTSRRGTTNTNVTVTESITPGEVSKREEVTTPLEVAKLKEDTKLEEVTKPKEDTKPKDDAKLKEDSKPKDDTKPEEDAKPKEDSKPKEDVKPEEDDKVKEDTEAKA